MSFSFSLSNGLVDIQGYPAILQCSMLNCLLNAVMASQR